MIRTCGSGHASLDAENWRCPWCEVAALRALIKGMGNGFDDEAIDAALAKEGK